MSDEKKAAGRVVRGRKWSQASRGAMKNKETHKREKKQRLGVENA